ncbi:MAG: EF-hand domain-containing protein [Telluria sp.]|nr:EF-hand domain-containing protein [Telluria sp.]
MKYLAFTLGAAAGALVGALLALDAWAQQPSAAQPALPVVPVAPVTQPLPPHRWTVQQVREAFDMADADNNGALTRAEIQRVAIVPRSFEEMDQNKDGVVVRAEFEAGFAR